MNNWKVKNPRNDLSFEIAFTKAHKEASEKYSHPAMIELECLKVQYPGILMPIQDEDILAGRVQFGMVGFGMQGLTGGLGYYIDEKKITRAIETRTGNAKYQEDIHDLLIYWKSRNTDYLIKKNTPREINDILPSDRYDTDPLPAFPIIRMAGAFLDFDKLVQIGIPGLALEIKNELDNIDVTGNDKIFYECSLGVLDILKDCCLHYQKEALALSKSEENPTRKTQMNNLAAALENISKRAPSSLLEAAQLVWLYSVMCPVIEFGRMDVYLGDLYASDIDAKKITREQALEIIKSLFRLIDALDCDTDGRVIIGGYGRRNPENADRFCLLACEASRTFKEILPQFTLRFNNDTPKAVWEAAMRSIGEGRTFPLLYNDEVLVPCVMKAFDVDRNLAENYMPLGCGEFVFDHYSFGTPNGLIITLKILELAIYGGFDPVSNTYISIKTKTLADCNNFDEFLSVFKRHLLIYIEAQAKYEKYIYDAVGKTHPFLMVTLLYDGCISRGKGIFDGGCKYLAGTVELYGNVDCANSLAAVKKLVFDDKKIPAPDLISILKNNFYGFDRERKMMMDCPKFGNDISYVDDIHLDIHNFICLSIKEQAKKTGLDSYLAVNINNSMNTMLGRWVGATPDGRKAGMPMANANNPASGSDKNGVIAMFNSILKMPHDNHAGMVQNTRFTKETWNSDEGARALINYYFKNGGAQAMISVVGKDDLLNAVKNPRDYKDLIVRIGGLSARFVNLSKDVQKEIYDRTTY
ncbi:MAG: hypothetical protein FWC21_02615 [Treponema sp.]|nr:hypothetical protein [Treponema sp.]